MRAVDFLYITHFKNGYRSMDVLFDWVDTSFSAGRFEEIDRFLKEVTVDFQTIQMLVGMLSITLATKSELKNRAEFFNRVFEKVTAERNPKSAARLLEGLK
jgi:hypothetical protein